MLYQANVKQKSFVQGGKDEADLWRETEVREYMTRVELRHQDWENSSTDSRQLLTLGSRPWGTQLPILP